MISFVFLYTGYFVVSVSLILMLFFVYGSFKMKSLYTKAHFFGAIDNFVGPMFLFGFICLICSNGNYFGFLTNFILSGKIFFLMLFLSFGSVISTHSICLSYFNENKERLIQKK